MRAETLQSMIEAATSPDLTKPDLELNKKICFALRDNEYLYEYRYYYSVPDSINLIRSKLLKKNPQVQCLAILLLGNTVRHCTARLHQQIATEEFMGILIKLLKVSGLSITVSFF